MEILDANIWQLMDDVPVMLMICTTILATLGGFLVYFYNPYWSLRNIPGPTAWPLVGHLPLFAKHGPDLFSQLAKTYGPIYRFHMGRQPLVIIADAELCREVGIKKFKDFPDRSVPAAIAAAPLHTKGLFMTKEPRWSKMRNKIISVYQPTNVASILSTMQSYVESATQNLESLGDFIISEHFLKLSSDVIGQTAFGVDFGLSKLPRLAQAAADDEEGQEFIKEHIYATTTLKMDLSGSISMILGTVFPLIQEPVRQILLRIPGTMDRKVENTNNKLSQQLDEIVLNRRNKEETFRDGSSSNDFLSLILKASEAETAAKKVFTEDYISALTYEQLLVGSTTIAFTLSTVIYLVAEHPEVETKLLKEIDDFGPFDQLPTALDLSEQFPYLNQVIKESMRFYTTSPLIAREAIRDVEVGGHMLPKGTWVWMAPGALAMDSKYFADPEKFKPERFDPECEEEKTRHPYAMFPFGIGPRACIGQKFAIQEMKLTLIQLYRKYIFRHSDSMEKPLELEYGIVLNFKHGVKVRAIKRTTTTT